jgi:peptidoglycan/xylan/chitin deacetylase (PgdA/CDA1 family)/sulfur carrier protein ThiS
VSVVALRRIGVVGVIVTVVGVVGTLLARRLFGGERASLTVTVVGQAMRVAEGTTLTDAVTRFGLHPRSGDLLDVNGKVLRAAAVSGEFLVDGRPGRGGMRLRSGDRVSVVDSHDQREPLARRVVRAAGGAPSDPQFTLSRTPGEQVIVSGALSHELVSARFRPLGATRVERAVALTFDDGPSAQYTPRILATLARLRVRATFFLVGYLAEANPELVRRELQLGLTVGNHSYNHPEVPPFAQLPPRLLSDEIALGGQALSRLGAAPRLFRPPGGSTSAAVVGAAAALGQRVVLWSVDPADWSPGSTAKEITKRVLAAVRPGSIVILHDGGGDRSATLAALPAIVRGIRHRGLHLVPLSADPTTTQDGSNRGPAKVREVAFVRRGGCRCGSAATPPADPRREPPG